jgi:hypothetical protein
MLPRKSLASKSIATTPAKSSVTTHGVSVTHH